MKTCKKMKHLLFGSLVLLGTASAAVTVQAADPKTPAVQHESVQPGSDTWITTKVKAALLAAKDTSGLDVKVETVNGVVSLSGTVDSQLEADRAVAVARGIEGVTRVESSVTVRGNSR